MRRGFTHGIEALPGQKVQGFIPVARMASGVPVGLTLHIATGFSDGPKLCLTSAIHGSETFSVEIVREVLSRLDTRTLRGAVLAIPVANPLAFDAQTFSTPSDGLDLNRAFLPESLPILDNRAPGDLTLRLARALAEVVSSSDCLLDYHCGPTGMAINYAYIPSASGELGRRVKDIARAYGLTVMYSGARFPGSISTYALSRQIPALVLEIGGGVDFAHTLLEGAVRGVFNVMKHIGMLDGKPELPQTQIMLKERSLIKPKYGGLLHTELPFDKLNEIVPKDQLICRVISPVTFEELEAIRAPYDQTVIFMLRTRHAVVQPGHTACFVGNVKSAELIHNEV